MKTKLLVFFLIFTTFKIAAQQQVYSFNSLPNRFIEFDNDIFFLAGNAETGREIWRSSGTTQTTSLVEDIYPGTENGGQDLLKKRSAILNGTLYFIGRDETSEGEIWKTDGTANGTVKVTNFLKGRVWSITAVENSIYFLLKSEENILQVWKTDGTSQGTVLVKDNLPIWNDPTFEGKCGNTFVFTFQPRFSNNSRVWRSDGTADGTFPITQEVDGNGSGPGGTSALSQYIESNGKLYFVSRYYLFETDGTLDNTKTVSNLWNAQSTLVDYSNVVIDGNNLYFLFFTTANFRMEIWKYNLETKKSLIVYASNNQKYFFPSGLTKTDDSLLFSGPNNTGGTSLLAMNLNDYSISDIKEISSTATKPFIFNVDIDVAYIYRFNNNQYFITSAADQSYQRKGWIYNKDKQTTENISALDNVWEAIVYKNDLYYGKDNILWKYANNLNTISNNKESFLILYPNPSADFVQINTNNDAEIESVMVYDLNGKMVSEVSNYKNNRIDISRLTKGIYNLQIKLNGNTFVNRKIIKK